MKSVMVKLREEDALVKVNITDENKPNIPDEIINRWQKILDVTTKIFQVPVGLITRINQETIEVLAANTSVSNPYKIGDGDKLGYGSYCETVIGKNSKLLIPNALKDRNWKDNPHIKYNLISYLGFPIHWSDQQVLGTICLLGQKENNYSEDFIALIVTMKEVIEADLKQLLLNEALTAKSVTDHLTKIYNKR